MMMDIKSAEGSSYPTWRLPINRTPAIMRMYKIMVRKRPVNKHIPSCLFSLSRPLEIYPANCPNIASKISQKKEFLHLAKERIFR